MPAVVLLSGGLDSAVNLKRARDEVGVALALTFDYGQRAAAREAGAAGTMCRLLDVPHRVLSLPWLAEICGGALVDPRAELPRVQPSDLDTASVTLGETAAVVWVPNRNGLFANIGAAFAESLGAELVVAGFNAEEAATFPDNSPGFVAAANACLRLSTCSGVRLVSYTQDLDKAAIVTLGRQIGAPIAWAWSCYEGGAEHCWECESCARFARGLRTAGAWEWYWEQRRLPPG